MYLDSKLICIKAMFGSVIKPHILKGDGATLSLDKLLRLTTFICQAAKIRTSPHVWKWPLRDDVIKWEHFSRYWPFVQWIHRSSVNSPHKGQWRVALIFSLICAGRNGWVDNWDAGDLRRHLAHFDVTVIVSSPMHIKRVLSYASPHFHMHHIYR